MFGIPHLEMALGLECFHLFTVSQSADEPGAICSYLRLRGRYGAKEKQTSYKDEVLSRVHSEREAVHTADHPCSSHLECPLKD